MDMRLRVCESGLRRRSQALEKSGVVKTRVYERVSGCVVYVLIDEIPWLHTCFHTCIFAD